MVHKNWKHLLLACFLLGNTMLSATLAIAQEEKGMLIFQVDGNRYIKRNFDQEGKLKNYQQIEVGKVIESENRLETKVTIISYGPDGNLLKANQTSLFCSPVAKQVLIGAFPILGEKTVKGLTLKMSGENELYPTDWQNQSRLDDFSFTLTVEGGVIGALGSKMDVAFTNRQIRQVRKAVYQIESTIVLQSSVLGFSVSSKAFRLEEQIDTEKGIIWQRQQEDSGKSFELELIEDS